MDIFLYKKNLAAASAAIICCIVMVCLPDITVLSVKKGLMLWIGDVVPSMLPFFICINFINKSGIMNYLSGSMFPFAASCLSGYPMGCKIVGDMFRSGKISRTEARRLVSFCNTSGPGFMIGAVGISMLGSHEAGLIISAAHYMGALCNCILFSKIYPRQKNYVFNNGSDTDNLAEKLTESIYTSFKSLCMILAYIVIFMFVTDIITFTGVFEIITGVHMEAIIKGFFEMTVGCSTLNGNEQRLLQNVVIAAVIISWGGLSVAGQCVSMLMGSGISVFYIMFTKVSHSFFAGIIALFMGSIML